MQQHFLFQSQYTEYSGTYVPPPTGHLAFIACYFVNCLTFKCCCIHAIDSFNCEKTDTPIKEGKTSRGTRFPLFPSKMKFIASQQVFSLLWLSVSTAGAFRSPSGRSSIARQRASFVVKQQSRLVLFVDPLQDQDSLLLPQEMSTPAQAATGTINDRLMAELQEATAKETFGARSVVGKKLGLDAFKSDKTDAERAAAVAAAKDLNGVNPLVALAGSAVALVVAGGLWWSTNWLGAFFALHPVETDVYFIQRATLVFRNAVMGLASLASGFFGVTGLGIFLLGVRVAYGVATGELDPTPIKKSKSTQELEMPNVMDLMMGKKPGRGNK
jgi:hypothetical protein